MRKFSNIMLALSIVSFILWLLFRWYYYQSFPKEKIEAAFEPISYKYGVKIVYEIGDDFFSTLKNPPIPTGPPRYSKVKPIRHRVLMRYPNILQKMFDKYPVEVIKNNLKAIYFAGEIDANGFKASGTYDATRRIIYFADNGSESDEAINTFHHEFSSLLMRNNSFCIKCWMDHNPEGFKYLREIYDDWNSLRKKIDILKEGGNDQFEKGIISVYGQTNLENDFNEYSEMIFTRPQKFRKIMHQYPRVREKFLVWLDFYQSIDSIFTEEYLFGRNVKANK